MKYSELDIPAPTREQQFLLMLDKINPVDAHECQITLALEYWLDQYEEYYDNITLEDMHYNEYAERFVEDIGPVELILCCPSWWSLLCSKKNGETKFYFWQANFLWYVGKHWIDVYRSILYVCDDFCSEEELQGLEIRRIPLKSGLTIWWNHLEGEADVPESLKKCNDAISIFQWCDLNVNEPKVAPLKRSLPDPRKGPTKSNVKRRRIR